MNIYYITTVVFILVSTFYLLKIAGLYSGKKRVEREISEKFLKKLSPFGSVKTFSLLPLVDIYSTDHELKTEAGVSYLVRTGDAAILVDVGFNAKKKHPSPLLHNMKKLGVSPKNIDMIFISHPHLDHLGGMEEQKKKVFNISKARVELPDGIKVYSPAGIRPGEFTTVPKAVSVDDPFVIKEGIASTGSIPSRALLST
jgi:7,8-dihydropterin-6-yl-methyl-4-(beta-D-ribofuranosyl)aminobenzene 5'-phosphate synthase